MRLGPIVSPLDPADWSFPVPIRYGPGRVRELPSLCEALGSTRPLVVTDRGSQDLPFIAECLAGLARAGLKPQLFSNVNPNPTDVNIAEGCDIFRRGDHDCVVAVGGGSGLDAGKGISLVAQNQSALWAFDFDDAEAPPLGASSFPPLVCIPTTAGTGAETESTAMVTDTERGIKRCVWHANQSPRFVILDPLLTVGLPPHLTAWTGCDALVHAIEAYTVPAWHPMCDGIACEAMRLVYRWLPDAVANGENVQARGAMLVGSCLAGIAFLKGLGLVHSISHMVGAEFDTHHGLTNAIVLPAVLRFNRDGIADKVPMMCQAMGLSGESFDDLYNAVVGLLDHLEIPKGLSALNVDVSRVPILAEKAFGDAATGTNAVPASAHEIEGILREAIDAAR
ncbi:MAG: iron-containing alcohol dehydrogenase [Pseudomonadota bacterium]